MTALPLWAICLLAVPALLNLWAIRHAFTHSFPSPRERILWMCAGVFVPFIGGLAYLLVGFRRAGRTGAE